MNELQLVTFEQAERLKKIGFNWGVSHHYNLGVEYPFSNKVGENYNDNDGDLYCSAPTVALALKWIRDIKGIQNAIEFYFVKKNSEASYQIVLSVGRNHPELWNTYEYAESALLDELLNILEK